VYIIRDREEEIEIDDNMDGKDKRREGEKNDRNNLPYTRACAAAAARRRNI